MLEHKHFYIESLKRNKDITIFLPENYKQTDKVYPVLYMLDGQNLFEDNKSYGGHSWGVLRTFNQGEKTEVIVVGIHHASEHRLDEYSPFEHSESAGNFLVHHQKQKQSFGGEGALFIKWLVDVLKPYIDNQYRTLSAAQNTALIGSSMGGYITTFAGVTYPDVFGNLGILSPAFWFNFEAMHAYVEDHPVRKTQYIFMRVGTDEGGGIADENTYLVDAQKMAKVFEKQTMNFDFKIVEGGRHHEVDWEQELSPMFDFFKRQLYAK